MSGGEISGNTASDKGGGVYLYNDGGFGKTGGTIYGSNGPVDGDKDMRNLVKTTSGDILDNKGHAVYRSATYHRETTLGPTDNLFCNDPDNDTSDPPGNRNPLFRRPPEQAAAA
jgi:parallel beta-helix repeat protein